MSADSVVRIRIGIWVCRLAKGDKNRRGGGDVGILDVGGGTGDVAVAVACAAAAVGGRGVVLYLALEFCCCWTGGGETIFAWCSGGGCTSVGCNKAITGRVAMVGCNSAPKGETGRGGADLRGGGGRLRTRVLVVVSVVGPDASD